MFGRYRNLLVPVTVLKEEARLLRPQIEYLSGLYWAHKISDACYALLFVLCFSLHRIAGICWFQNKRYLFWSELFKELSTANITSTKELCANLRARSLRGMPGFVLPTLACWLEGGLRVHLVESVVTPAEMLAAQAQGFRYVTLPILQALAGDMLGERDALEFLLHDLAHADTFFRAEYDPVGQQQFFSRLQQDIPHLQPMAKEDEKFREQLEYLMSDMNSHPQHLRQYLRAVILDFGGRNNLAQAEALLEQLVCLRPWS